MGLTDAQVTDFKTAFGIYDFQRSKEDKEENPGVLNQKELGMVMRSVGQCPSVQDVQDIFKQVDQAGTGAIDLDTVLEAGNIMADKMAATSQEGSLKEALGVFDKNSSGTISAACASPESAAWLKSSR